MFSANRDNLFISPFDRNEYCQTGILRRIIEAPCCSCRYGIVLKSRRTNFGSHHSSGLLTTTDSKRRSLIRKPSMTSMTQQNVAKERMGGTEGFMRPGGWRRNDWSSSTRLTRALKNKELVESLK